MWEKVKALLKSRRFIAAVVGVAAIVASEAFGVKLDTEQITAIVVMISSWILGDSLRKTE